MTAATVAGTRVLVMAAAVRICRGDTVTDTLEGRAVGTGTA
ncbi:hypothetical protein [Actinokineospora cianjurensis]|nr:hypothetical protein [Actinokineospora cianjurensis]